MSSDTFLNRGFTFQCPAWRRCALQQVLLTKVSQPVTADVSATAAAQKVPCMPVWRRL